jgi:hypothetical protein
MFGSVLVGSGCKISYTPLESVYMIAARDPGPWGRVKSTGAS